MPELKELVHFLDNFLKIDEIEDTCWNGLQFEGRGEVQRVVFAVDAAARTFEEAAKVDADMIVVHHGHFWKKRNPSISDWKKQRIDILYRSEISLYACHLPLDRHREVGNNAQLLKLLGAEITDEFLMHNGKNIGWIGERQDSVCIEEVEDTLESELDSASTVLPFGVKHIKTIAACSGGGGYGGFYEALEAGVDLYLTGDAVEIYFTAKDSGINIIFAGHHATETIGLKALAEVVEERYEVETFFIDLPTGL